MQWQRLATGLLRPRGETRTKPEPHRRQRVSLVSVWRFFRAAHATETEAERMRLGLRLSGASGARPAAAGAESPLSLGPWRRPRAASIDWPMLNSIILGRDAFCTLWSVVC